MDERRQNCEKIWEKTYDRCREKEDEKKKKEKEKNASTR
jgi:hypothetical protein